MALQHLRVVAALTLVLACPARAEGPEGTEFFEKRVRPILVEHCYDCHGPVKKVKGGLRLDTRASVLKGGKTGPALIPGDADKSLLIQAVRYGNPDLQMPPDEKLTDAQIADLVAWVKSGAPDPRTDEPPHDPAPAKSDLGIEAARSRFPYTPVKPQPVPAVRDTTWPHNDIDRFILAKLESNDVQPAAPADRRTLIRRATYDLTGLPPTDTEVEAFLADPSPNAFVKVVDRLLASPAYGQRYARYWLDLVRYTDSFDARVLGGPQDCADAWRYRDWVVDAFNHDLPYDQFVRAQIAGDLMKGSGLRVQGSVKNADSRPPSPKGAIGAPSPGSVTPVGEGGGEGRATTRAVSRSLNPEPQPLNPLIATSVYALGNWGGGDADKEKLLTDIVDDQIDLTGRAFLGLTLACARCHDHKFDPISTEDYYALAGIFFSSHILPNVGPKTNGPDMLRIPLASPEELARRDRLKSELTALEKSTTFARTAFTPMREPVRDLRNIPGLHALKPPGRQDTPSATFNTTDHDVAFITIKMPPHTVAVHPPPVGGVAAVFECPQDATVTLAARVADADPSCGDGIEYRLLHRPRDSDAATTLASGATDNGKSATLSAGPLKIAAGDRIELLVLPRAEYTCDTTLIDLKITPADSSQPTHDLRTEVLAAPFATNTPWHFDQVAPDPRIAALRAELAAPLPTTHGLQEGGCPGSPHAGVHDVKVHIRGRYDRLGPTVPRGFPRVLAGDQQPTIPTGSGRAELAQWVSSPTNPMTARVLVNRLWQWHFGDGIVRTPNNFGKLGTPPTHPELLDWLADQFVKRGWSIKAMHRLIMLSATYQQSASNPQSSDADNLLLSRMNRRRLDAEGIRDAMLSVTGELSTAAGGPAVKDLSSPRRTLYLLTVRSDRTGYRMLFDAADPTAIIDKRTDSTVAPQALFLMNHPFVTARAKKLASNLIGPDRARVDHLYRALFSRPANDVEVALALQFLSNHHWEQYCHALLCSNEFVYVD